MSSSSGRKPPLPWPPSSNGQRTASSSNSLLSRTVSSSSSSSSSSLLSTFRTGGGSKRRRRRQGGDVERSTKEEEEKEMMVLGSVKPRLLGLGVIGRQLGRLGRGRRRRGDEATRTRRSATTETVESFSEGCDKAVAVEPDDGRQEDELVEEKEEKEGSHEMHTPSLSNDQILSMLSEPDEGDGPLVEQEEEEEEEDEDEEGDGYSTRELSTHGVREISDEAVASWEDLVVQNRRVLETPHGSQVATQQHEGRFASASAAAAAPWQEPGDEVARTAATKKTKQDKGKGEEKLKSAPLAGESPPRPHANNRQFSSLRDLSDRFQAAIPMYARVSSVAAVLMFQVTLRLSNGQFYLAMMRLQQSTMATLVFGNASFAISLLVMKWVKRFYQGTALFFLTTLRPEESRRLWTFNVVAGFWIFVLLVREDAVTLSTMTLLLLWFLAGPLHQVVRKRIEFLRGTEEALVLQRRRWSDANSWFRDGVTEQNSVGIFVPMSWRRCCIVRIRWSHVKAVAFCMLLLMCDVGIMALSAVMAGAAHKSQWMVYFTFGFEATVLAVEAVFTLGLHLLFVWDTVVSIAEESLGTPPQQRHTPMPWGPRRCPPWYKRRLPTRRELAWGMVNGWNDSRGMLLLTVGLVEKTVYFLLYFFFFFVSDKQGKAPPAILIKLILSCHVLNESVQSIASYRRLVRHLEEAFDSVSSEAELEAAGGSCIVCREVLGGSRCKRLPVCGHVFHRSCLREWFAHGKTKCPTCMTLVDPAEAEAASAEAAAKRLREEERRRMVEDGEELMSPMAHDFPFREGGNL